MADISESAEPEPKCVMIKKKYTFIMLEKTNVNLMGVFFRLKGWKFRQQKYMLEKIQAVRNSG